MSVCHSSCARHLTSRDVRIDCRCVVNVMLPHARDSSVAGHALLTPTHYGDQLDLSQSVLVRTQNI